MNGAGKRALFWSLFFLYAAGSLWWLASMPRNPDQVLRAIPGQAVSVSMHHNLAGRWNELGAHPLTETLAGIFGQTTNEWAELQGDPGFRTLLNLVGQDELAIAYVPYMNVQQQGEWVFASWIGGKSQRLRWSYRYMNLTGLTRLTDLGGWPVWEWTWETTNGIQGITLALVEGMIIGTTARHRIAMEMILDAYNGSFPSVFSRKDLAEWKRRLMDSGYDDRGWYRHSGWPGTRPWFVGAELSAGGGLRGMALTDQPEQIHELPETLDMDGLASLWKNHPIATTAFGVDALMPLLDQYDNFMAAALARDVIHAGNADFIAISLFGGERSGRFRGIKVPALMVGFQLPYGVDIRGRLSTVIDRWNAKHRLGIVPVETVVGTNTVWRFEGIAGGIYAGLAADEQVAMTLAGNWMVVSSNLKTLQSLIEQQGDALADEATWLSRIEDAQADRAAGYLGFDLVRGSEAFRLAITAYSLKLLFDDASGTREQRQQLNEAKAWLDVIARLQHIHLLVSSMDPYLKIDFVTGP
jgi:hypothetical protein